MRELIGFVIAYVLYLGALWLFPRSFDKSTAQAADERGVLNR
jgi:uncharacterized membrane protein (GlpM family)